MVCVPQGIWNQLFDKRIYKVKMKTSECLVCFGWEIPSKFKWFVCPAGNLILWVENFKANFFTLKWAFNYKAHFKSKSESTHWFLICFFFVFSNVIVFTKFFIPQFWKYAWLNPKKFFRGNAKRVLDFGNAKSKKPFGALLFGELQKGM